MKVEDDFVSTSLSLKLLYLYHFASRWSEADTASRIPFRRSSRVVQKSLNESSGIGTSLRKNSSSTRLLHDPFISSYVGLANSSGVRVPNFPKWEGRLRGRSIPVLEDHKRILRVTKSHPVTPHPKFSTHDEEDKDEEIFDSIVQTPSQVENTDDEDNDEDSHGMNVEGDKGANEEDDGNELYEDVNINLEVNNRVRLCRLALFRTCSTQSPDTCIDSIFESTPWVDVLVTTTAEPPLLSAKTLPLPSILIISHVQQTPTNVPSLSLQDLPNFGSLFGFDHRLKTLETNFSKFMQTNQFAKAISLIFGIVDKYLDQRMNEAVKVVIQLQSDRLRDEAQAENEDFLNKLDENIQKIINE
nr:hypothetical protein [Tanacetum cinerariifolium]